MGAKAIISTGEQHKPTPARQVMKPAVGKIVRHKYEPDVVGRVTCVLSEDYRAGMMHVVWTSGSLAGIASDISPAGLEVVKMPVTVSLRKSPDNTGQIVA